MKQWRFPFGYVRISHWGIIYTSFHCGFGLVLSVCLCKNCPSVCFGGSFWLQQKGERGSPGSWGGNEPWQALAWAAEVTQVGGLPRVSVGLSPIQNSYLITLHISLAGCEGRPDLIFKPASPMFMTEWSACHRWSPPSNMRQTLIAEREGGNILPFFFFFL